MGDNSGRRGGEGGDKKFVPPDRKRLLIEKREGRLLEDHPGSDRST